MDTTPVSFDFTVLIAEGEHINFVGNRKSNHTADEIHFSATVSAVDFDDDGMPDEWEVEQSGAWTNLTATGDFDGDGSSDFAEYIAGTHPTNPASVFAVSPSAWAPNPQLEWSTVSGRVYSVYWSSNLVDGF